MAKVSKSTAEEYAVLKREIEAHRFSPVYVLMGEEPYYVDSLVELLENNVLSESERDFNRTVFYGMDADVSDVVYTAMSYPVFSQRRLVVVRQAQMMKKQELLQSYFEAPLESTVLVLAYSGSAMDKRKSIYKKALATGVVFESLPVRDYQMPSWISTYVKSEGYDIDPDAAELLAEHCGTELKIVTMELTKLMRLLPEGNNRIDLPMVEGNTGISREFSVFELTKALSMKDVSKSYRIAHYIGLDSKKTPMVLVMGALVSHFLKILKLEALELNGRKSDLEISSATGIFRSYVGEYRLAASHFPMKKCMGIIAMLAEYDFKLKSGGAGEASDREFLMEITGRILNS